MEASTQPSPESRTRVESTVHSFLQRHNPLRESNYTGLWHLEDEDGTDTGITLSKDSITIPPNTQPPIMIIWATEKKLENRAKEMEIQNYFPINTTTKGTLRRLFKDLGNNFGDDDEEVSQNEPMKVLIYRANLEFRRYEPVAPLNE